MEYTNPLDLVRLSAVVCTSAAVAVVPLADASGSAARKALPARFGFVRKDRLGTRPDHMRVRAEAAPREAATNVRVSQIHDHAGRVEPLSE